MEGPEAEETEIEKLIDSAPLRAQDKVPPREDATGISL